MTSTRTSQTRPPNWLAAVAGVADSVRRRVLRFTLQHNGGYLSQACSSAEILATLYLRAMRLGDSVAPHEPPLFAGVPGPDSPRRPTGAGYNGPHDPALDRFVFSPVHYALVLYATLIEVGRLSSSALEKHFNADGGTVELIGAEHSPGHEVTAGSLAQALSQAGGIALARRLKGESGRVFVFMSDGEFEEGQTWEALAALSHHHVDNLSIVIDANGQQCDGELRSVGSIEPLRSRLAAFGAYVREVDGHDVVALGKALATRRKGAPVVVIARTDPCHGLELLRSRAPQLHYVRFANDQERAAFAQALQHLDARSA